MVKLDGVIEETVDVAEDVIDDAADDVVEENIAVALTEEDSVEQVDEPEAEQADQEQSLGIGRCHSERLGGPFQCRNIVGFLVFLPCQ